MPLIPGQVLNNRYRVVKLLGKGGFGAVYRAWDMNLDEPVALKESSETTPAAQKQFQLEGKLLFKLHHANLPRVHDFFVIPGQGMYLVMDYIEGEDLGKMLEQAGGPLPEAQVLNWANQVCEALYYLHKQNPPIIHRDIKPANIRITPAGKAMLVDFGIAKVYDPGLSTTMGARAATPGYAPFEQYGMDTTDERTDVYALGATLYHLLTGEVPVESIARMKGQALPPLRTANPAISPETDNVIIKAIAVMPEDRYQDMGAFQRALRAAARPARPSGVQPITHAAARSSPSRRAPAGGKQAAAVPGVFSKRLPRSCIVAASAVVVVVLVLLAIAFGGWGVDGDDLTGAERIQAVLAPLGDLIDRFPAASPQPTGTIQAIATSTRTEALTNTPTLSIPPASPTADFGAPMALIPAGEFRMGSESGDTDESPVHTVYLDAFYIDVYNVTNTEFRQCVDEGVCVAPLTCNWGEPTYEDTDKSDHPVVCVNWEQAQTYCAWRGARLPTEAEWEKAARGGLEGMIYPWGNEDPVCTPGAPNGAQFSSCNGDTIPVGTFSANGYGLFDMAGNVWEWVADWYDGNYYDISPFENPNGPESGDHRVLRGGGWDFIPDHLRAASRNDFNPVYRIYDFGFRCASAAAPGR